MFSFYDQKLLVFPDKKIYRKNAFIAMSDKQKELYHKSKVMIYFHCQRIKKKKYDKNKTEETQTETVHLTRKNESQSKEGNSMQTLSKKGDEKDMTRRKTLSTCIEKEARNWNGKQEMELNVKDVRMEESDSKTLWSAKETDKDVLGQRQILESEIKKLRNENKKMLDESMSRCSQIKQLEESLQAVSDSSREVAKTAMEQEQQLIQFKQALDLKTRQLNFYRHTVQSDHFVPSFSPKFFRNDQPK
ncbi:S-layer y domain protein, partial [Reticulomyxa filosa]